MSFAGTGVVAIWHDVVPEARDEFYEWHNREHMPERLGIPGFQRGRRYIALDAGPVYFNLYEADSVQVLGAKTIWLASTPRQPGRRRSYSLTGMSPGRSAMSITAPAWVMALTW